MATKSTDTIKYKNIIKKSLLNCPELLYSFGDKELEAELYDKNGNLLIDHSTGELTGEVDRYFGDNSHIRQMLYFPEAQVTVESYLCYQVMFDEIPRYQNTQKYTQIIFTVFVNGLSATDKLTGLPRHDLIATIIRERFNWSNIFGMQAKLISSKESTTDNNFLVRTLTFQITDVNSITYTPFNESTYTHNYKVRR